MNLLLLLSALLSALTGVSGGGRLAQATQVVAADVSAVQTPVARVAQAASRPVAALPSLRAVAAAFLPRAQAPFGASLLLTTGRRRE